MTPARRDPAAVNVASRPPRTLLALALLAAGTSCVPQRVAPGSCSLPGRGRWHEHRSAHFVIDVQGEDRDPEKVVAAFEELHAAVVASLIADPVEIPGRVRVVVLPSRSALAGVVGSRDIGGVFSVSALGEPTIVLSVDALDDMPQIVAHELAHHVAFHVFPRQPYWFAEGLAQFVEGVAKVDREGRRWAGGEPLLGWAADGVRLTRTVNLLAGGGTFLDNPQLTSWILYRYLWNEQGPRLSEFQERLSYGEAPAEAWRAVFPEWDPAGGATNVLDGALERHRRRGVGLRWQVSVPAVDRTFTTSLASTADLHMVLLGVRLFRTNKAIAPLVRRAAAEEALREEATNPVALAELAAVDGTPALPALRASVSARPEDGRGWYLLARASDDPKEREDALRRAVERWPDGALAHAALASELARTGRASEAVREVNRGLELAPWNAGVIAVLARVALDLGRCREALLLASRAVDVAGSPALGSGDADVEALRRQVDETRKRCEAPAAGAAPGAR